MVGLVLRNTGKQKAQYELFAIVPFAGFNEKRIVFDFVYKPVLVCDAVHKPERLSLSSSGFPMPS